MGRHYQSYQTNEDHSTRMETLSQALNFFFILISCGNKQNNTIFRMVYLLLLINGNAAQGICFAPALGCISQWVLGYMLQCDDGGGDSTNIVITSSLHLIKILY